MNDKDEESISPQERIIYEIVEDILRTEDKIAELSDSLTHDNKSSSLSVELMTLRNEKSNFALYIKELRDEMSAKLSPNQKVISKKEAEVNRLNNRMEATENELKHLAKTAKGNVYLMSYEKIEDMINSKKINDDIKMIDEEIATSESLKLSIEASLNENKNKQNELIECMMMLKEEKETYKDEVVNIISQKESIEEIIKLYAQFQIKQSVEWDINSKSNTNGNRNKKEIDLSYYEIAKVDINKVINQIDQILIGKHSLIHQSSLEVNENLMTVQSMYMNNSMKNLILEYINQYNHSSNATEAFISRLAHQLVKIVKSNQIALDDLDLNDETYEMTKEITFPIEENINEDSLGLYIKYIFKASFYEEVIKQILSFTSKDYKAIKKTLEKQVNAIQNTMTKLVTRIDETDTKLMEIRKRKKYLIDNHKPRDVIELSFEEKEYIKQNEALSLLKNDKEDIEHEIETLRFKNNEIKDDYERKIEEKRDEEKGIEQKINDLNQEIKNEQLEVNDTIIKLRQQIAEKFTIIKEQLKIYREKHGNNLLLYNKLVESINSTIKLTSKNKSQGLEQNQLVYSTERSLYTSPSQLGTSRSNIIVPVFNPKKNYLAHSSSMTNVCSLKENKQRESTLSLNSEEMPYLEKITYSTRKRIPNPSKMNKCTEQTSIWLKERDKLNRTIKNLKEKISKTENIFDKAAIVKQLKPLTNLTPCYSRFVSSKDKKFNPLYDSLCLAKEFSFIKASIALDDSFYNLLIRNSQDEIKSIPLESINNTIVSTFIKHIIQIFRESRRSKIRLSIEDFANKKEFASIPLTNSEKAKAALNTHFNFSIQFKKEQRIEFVFSSYEEFKLWLNGLAYVIKNRSSMNKYHALLK